MKEGIENSGPDLRTTVVVLTNAVLETGKTKDLGLQLGAMKNLADELANTPGAINTLSQLQEDRDVLKDKRVLLSRNSRKLINRAISLGVDPIVLRAELAGSVREVKKKGRDRLNRGDLKELALAVKDELMSRRLSPVI